MLSGNEQGPPPVRSGPHDRPARASGASKNDGALAARKFAREGAGLISSLTQTDGLVVLGEDVTRVEPGDIVGFVAYSALV